MALRVSLAALLCFSLATLPQTGSAQEPNLKQRLDSARRQVSKLKGVLAAAEKKRVELAQQAGEVAKTIETTKTAITPIEANQRKLEAEYAAAVKEAQKLEATATSARERRDSHRAIVAELSAKLRQLEQALAESERSVASANKTLAEATAQLAAKNAEATKAAAANKVAAEKLAKFTQTHEVATQAVAAAKKAAEQAEANKKQISAAAAATAQGLASATQAIARLVADAKANPTDKQAQESATSATETLTQLKATADGLKQLEVRTTERVKTTTAELKQAELAQANAKAALKPVAEAAQKSAETLKAAQAAVSKVTATIASAKAVVNNGGADQVVLKSQIAGLAPSVRKAELELRNFEKAWLKHQKKAETKLSSVGLFTSFANDVAPIFAQRCLACHNSHKAEGRYNMDSLALILKGGESGAAVKPKSSAESHLFELISDGSMPQDADPLTAAEIAVIRKWIDAGASADAGVSVGAPLVEVMPKAPHPEPPATYSRAVPITALAFSPDEQVIASSGYHEVLLWNSNDGKPLRRISNVAERVHEVEFSRDGKTIAVAAGTPALVGEVKLFRASDGELLGDFLRTGDSVFSVAFSPDGKRIAVGSADNRVRVFAVATGEELLNIDEHSDWVMDVAWSPDGRQLASASRDKTVKTFDSATGEPLWTLNGHTHSVYSVCFTPNGKQVVSASGDKEIRVWDGSTGKLVRRIRGFGNEIFRLAMTPQGEAVSVSADKTARLHNVGNGKELRRFGGHNDWVYSLALANSGKRIATGGYDGEIRIWNASDAALVLKFAGWPGAQESQSTAAR